MAKVKLFKNGNPVEMEESQAKIVLKNFPHTFSKTKNGTTGERPSADDIQPAPEKTDNDADITKSDLLNKKKAELLEAAEELGLELNGDETKEQLADLIIGSADEKE